MSQALHTASTGINSGQSQINVIAHNVANINTVAFKSANLTFETLYSRNLSYGSAGTQDGGGTNPKQIGLGVKVGGITRNFTPGTFVSTGRDMDCMISGTGFFVVKDAEGKQFFTRDGIFSVDSQGNLVTQNGMKVVGARTLYSVASSDKTVKIPKNLKATVIGDPDIGSKKISELNNASITTGKISATITEKDGTTHDVSLEIEGDDPTISSIIESFNEALKKADTDCNISFSAENGTISYTESGDCKLSFNSEGTTSNFLAQTGLANSNTSWQISQCVNLQDMVNYNDRDGISLQSTAIDENGIIVATYTDGSILTQYIDGTETIQWQYTTPDGVLIRGNQVNAEGSVMQESNFVIELATMVNQEGLVSTTGNLWEWGPNCGEIFYGMAGEMAFGPIESGGYEESNVDIAFELSNMISAQRMIQMNSRVFSTASNVMETLAYLGQ